MTRYLTVRIASMLPVVVIVSVLVYSLILLLPGDPVYAILGDGASPEQYQRTRVELGLDQPGYLQYLSWLRRLLSGDLGRSVVNKQPVVEAIAAGAPVTLQLSLMGMLLSILVSLPLGTLAAVHRDSSIDAAASLMALIGVCIPFFWLGLLLILLFSVALHWLPAGGFVPFAENPRANLASMLLPAITVGIGQAAVLTRQVRSAMLEVLHEDYIRTARAKGVGERFVIVRHALRNTLIPFITVVGVQIGNLLGGAVVTETIFSLPGLGRLVVGAIYQRDLPVVQVVVLLTAVAVLIANLVADVLYAYVNPRIRYT